jgi:His/Glu/Gln/Arg/opine family amino acid ABC transporter permease subunit
MNELGSLITNVLPAGKVTLEIAFGSWAISIILGTILALVGFEGGRIIRWTAAGFGMVLRSMPPLVVLYLIYFGLPDAGISLEPIWAAIVGLGVLDGVYSAEYFRGAFRTVPPQQWEAAYSLGISRSATTRLVIVPEMLPFMMPPIINSLVGLMKGAVFASAIGAPELLFTGEQYMTNTGRVTATAVFIMALYLIVTVPLTRFASRLERRVRTNHG